MRTLTQELQNFALEVMRRLRIPFELSPLRTHKPVLLIILQFGLRIHQRLILQRLILPFLKIDKPREIIGELRG